ncbi:hypothetical protein PHYC_02008 [Phycisphaerales bacterium]|nr:hypothetical protein PHYC_02008 [Phycisphaerales bacterium]
MGIADQIQAELNDVLRTPWDVRSGRVVPDTENIALRGGGVRFDAVILYADMAGSSSLVKRLSDTAAAHVYKCFLHGCCRVIRERGGEVTAFDGDRVMAAFLGDGKELRAAMCGLQINWVVREVITPSLKRQHGLPPDFSVGHAVGIDASPILVAKTGIRNYNDLVWVGRAANVAAKLSGLREAASTAWITGQVFDRLTNDTKYGGEPRRLMWEQQSWMFEGDSLRLHRSNWTWKP